MRRALRRQFTPPFAVAVGFVAGIIGSALALTWAIPFVRESGREPLIFVFVALITTLAALIVRRAIMKRPDQPMATRPDTRQSPTMSRGSR